MDDNTICSGHTSCTVLAVIVCLLFVAIFFNYIVRCLDTSQFHHTSVPLTTIASPASVFPNTPLSVNSPLYRRVLKSIPMVTYEASPCPSNYAPTPSSNGGGSSSSKSNSNNNNNNFESENCAICLAEFEEGEGVRVMPRCKHVFHVECIDEWLRRSLRCPICRERVVDQQQIHPKLLSTDHHIGLSTNHHLTAAPLVISVGSSHSSVFI